MNRELNDAMEAGVLTPCNSHSDWVHQMFPVPKPGKSEVRLVSDFKRLNSALQRPVFPVESNSQLLRHIPPDSKFFCTLDMTSGYHQCEVHPDDRELLTVICQQGRFRYNCLSQGICSASDFFNFLSDGNVRWEACWRKLLKNMDDVLMGAPTLEALEAMVEEFLQSCHAKNIKLKPSKFVISTCVEFGGCRISADRLRDKGFIFIQPKEGRVRAFAELKRPSTKREAQVW